MPGNTTLPRAGGRVRARRRDGGRWHKARVVAVRDDACDLDFANYGVVEGVPAERIQGTEAPTRRRPPPASLLPKPRIRVRKAGHKPAEPYRGDRKVDKRLKDSIGWCATRGDVDTLEEVLRRRGLGARDAHGWSWLHHAAAGGATDHLKAILRVVRDHDDDDDEEEAPLEACEDLNGMTPLHLACVAKPVDCVRLLLKAGACAGDGLRQQLKGSRFPHHRARAAAGVPAALRQHVAAAASPVSVIGLPSSDELGDRCGSTRRTRSAPRRISSQIRRGVRLKAQGSAGGSGPGACQMRVQITRRPALARATAPGAGWDVSSRVLCSRPCAPPSSPASVP